MLPSEKLKTATHLEVDAEVRYWEDATVNGVEDTDGTLIFGRFTEGKEDTWKVRLNLAEGRIEDWPADMTADIHYKVCDAGLYWLQDANGERIAKYKDDYVPGDFLCHGDSGFGDYIILKVSPGGGIANYEVPEIDPEYWDILYDGA